MQYFSQLGTQITYMNIFLENVRNEIHTCKKTNNKNMNKIKFHGSDNRDALFEDFPDIMLKIWTVKDKNMRQETKIVSERGKTIYF